MQVATASVSTSLNPNRCMALISISILVYEQAITINQEVERFWAMHKLNWTSFLFYANRYLTLFGHIPIVFEHFWIAWFPEKVIICHRLQFFHQVLAVIIQTVTASLLTMRIYVLYDRNRNILASLMVFPAIAIVIVCWALATEKLEMIPLSYVGCDAPINHTNSTHDMAMWSVMVAFDTLIIVLTVYKTLKLHRQTGANLPMLILRDGSIYYLAIMVANLANILTLLLSKPVDRGSVTPLLNVISSVLISRQMLNLRDPELTNGTTNETQYRTCYTRDVNLLSTIIDPATSSECAVMETPRDPEYHDRELG